MKILAIDPSVNQCGWATVEITETSAEFKWGMWEISGINFQMRCADIRDYIISDVGEFDEFVGEWPMYYDSEKGRVAAKQGFTINLAGIVMFIAGWFQIIHQRLHLYTAPEWKGTVPKAVTARRFFKVFGVDSATVDHNAVDATMMLHFHCKLKGLIA